MAAFRLLHISDLHIAGEANRYTLFDPDKPGASFIKCLTKLQSPLKIPSHDSRAARALAIQLKKERDRYDAILISGDIATTGSDEDLSAAYSLLHGKVYHKSQLIEQIPAICDTAKLIWMPGNHDRYKDNSLRPGCKRFESANYFGKSWRKSGQFPTDLGMPDGPVHSYHLQKDGSQLTIICADFSYKHLSITGDHIGQGYASSDVLNELKRVTEASRERFEITAVAWVIHFPPAFPEISQSLKLVNDDKLLSLAEELNISVIFSGHTHKAADYRAPNNQNIRIICCGTTLEHQVNQPELCLQVIELDVLSCNEIDISLNVKYWKEGSDGKGKFC